MIDYESELRRLDEALMENDNEHPDRNPTWVQERRRLLDLKKEKLIEMRMHSVNTQLADLSNVVPISTKVGVHRR